MELDLFLYPAVSASSCSLGFILLSVYLGVSDCVLAVPLERLFLGFSQSLGQKYLLPRKDLC